MVTVETLPDRTLVVVGGDGGINGTVSVWRLADGSPAGEPFRGHTGPISAVTIGVLPDGCPVVVSGGGDGTVPVCRLTDGTPLVSPLDLSASGRGHRRSWQHHRHRSWVDIAVHQPVLLRPLLP